MTGEMQYLKLGTALDMILSPLRIPTPKQTSMARNNCSEGTFQNPATLVGNGQDIQKPATPEQTSENYTSIGQLRSLSDLFGANVERSNSYRSAPTCYEYC